MSTTTPQTIDPNGIKVVSDDQTQQMTLSMTDPTNKGLILDYDLTGTAKQFSISNSGFKWTNGVNNYTTTLDRIALIQQAFSAVQLPPNSTTLSVNNDLQFNDGVTSVDVGIVGSNLQISSATGKLTSTITQPAASDSTTNIPTTAWVQSAIDAKTTIVDTDANSKFYPLFSSDVSNQTFRADKTTTPWSINPNIGDFNFGSNLNITNVSGAIQTSIGNGVSTAIGSNSVAIGLSTGQTAQGTSCVAIGRLAGQSNQGNNSVSIGLNSGNSSQGSGSVAVGNNAGQTSQSTSAVAIGINAGTTTQGGNSVAIGSLSGNNAQAANCVAVGVNSAQRSQGGGAVAVGINSGRYGQGTNAVAIGSSAGAGNADANLTPIVGTTQGTSAVAIGVLSGRYGQGGSAIAIGNGAGTGTIDGNGNVVTNQLGNAIAIGTNAGTAGQGASAIAIGNNAGTSNQVANSIILNASGNATQATNAGFYVRPIRNDTTKQAQVQFNTSTFEVTQVAQVVSPVTTGGLDVTGDAALLSATAGGSSGQHLRIVINGVTYKIALLNN